MESINNMKPFISSLNATLLQELKNDEAKVNEDYSAKLEKLRMDYINKIAEFNIGDFIYNVTGIIKVDKISYDMRLHHITVVYIGKKYKKINGNLSRTKDKKECSMMSNLKKLK